MQEAIKIHMTSGTVLPSYRKQTSELKEYKNIEMEL